MNKNFNICPKCGYQEQDAKFIKCKNCEFVPGNIQEKWKPMNLGKQHGKPKANYDGKKIRT